MAKFHAPWDVVTNDEYLPGSLFLSVWYIYSLYDTATKLLPYFAVNYVLLRSVYHTNYSQLYRNNSATEDINGISPCNGKRFSL